MSLRGSANPSVNASSCSQATSSSGRDNGWPLCRYEIALVKTCFRISQLPLIPLAHLIKFDSSHDWTEEISNLLETSLSMSHRSLSFRFINAMACSAPSTPCQYRIFNFEFFSIWLSTKKNTRRRLNWNERRKGLLKLKHIPTNCNWLNFQLQMGSFSAMCSGVEQMKWMWTRTWNWL